MAFERRQPSVELRAFLDPLKPGSYFDCGEARLHGIDDALEAEAIRRGRDVGEDEFQLVATDGGLIFCRASISFAIAARWKDLNVGRPVGTDMGGTVLLPIRWPTHGELEFSVSRRLGSNVFRRWLQIQAQATRRHKVELEVKEDQREALGVTTDHGLVGVLAGQAVAEAIDGDEPPSQQGQSVDDWIDSFGASEDLGRQELDLRDLEPRDVKLQDEETAINLDQLDANGHRPIGGPDFVGGPRPVNGSQLVQPTEPVHAPEPEPDHDLPEAQESEPANSEWLTLDEELVGSWVDDRVSTPTAKPSVRLQLGDEHPTSDPFEFRRQPRANPKKDDDDWLENFEFVEAKRPSSRREVDPDSSATQFMARTADGTEVFPDDPIDDGFGSRNSDSPVDIRDNGIHKMPAPEIQGARLHRPPAAAEPDFPEPMNIRSAVLAQAGDTPIVELLRHYRLPILAAVSVLAIVLLVIIGLIAGGRDTDSSTGVSAAALAESSTITTTVGQESSVAEEQPESFDSGSTTETTAPQSALRVETTGVQICHSNYGGCVPVAADVDCEGDGDGPAFQTEPVAVFGDDVYDLDTDDDRQACEPDQPLASADPGSEDG